MTTSADPFIKSLGENRATGVGTPETTPAPSAKAVPWVVGLDIGAVTVGLVGMSREGEIWRRWRRHRGHPVGRVRDLLSEIGAPEDVRIGVVGAGAEHVTAQGVGLRVDGVRALVEISRGRLPEARHIIDVGGGSLSRITVDTDGGLVDYATNSLCAAGTGSFLDEQAERLSLDPDAPTAPGEALVTDPPTVATRCAVFAKSDLIHRQQEGHGKVAMWSGLCRGLSSTIQTTLFKGKPARGKVALIGGVARNAEVLRWLQERLPDGVETFEGAELAGAAGAAWLVEASNTRALAKWTSLVEQDGGADDEPRRKALTLERSDYPSFEVARSWSDDGTEIRLHRLPRASSRGALPETANDGQLGDEDSFAQRRRDAEENREVSSVVGPLGDRQDQATLLRGSASLRENQAGDRQRGDEDSFAQRRRDAEESREESSVIGPVGDRQDQAALLRGSAPLRENQAGDRPPLRVWMGLDIGSTSTKVVLLDEDGEVVADLYRKTGGDPIDATKRLFANLQRAFDDQGHPLEVLGAATTGSGRKLVGAVIGADLVQNEITAHVTGAMEVDPSIETIFEIGGQDAKYMSCRGGQCRDSAMNYVCAAGTGSFVEEQANKLGFSVQDVGDAVMGLEPPMTSDRCTVFMEQDVDALIRRGFSREEAMAGVLYSVVQNYLGRVVGTRPYSREKVFFQGATARNKGLVAAFERLLGVEVVVSPLCHVMGAYGVALLAKRRAGEGRCASAFRGLDLASREVALTEDTCRLCDNLCTITTAEIAGDPAEAPARASWGYLCGREPDDEQVARAEGYEAFRQRRRSWRRLHEGRMPKPARGRVGIPRAMGVQGYLPMWQTLLAELGYQPVLSKSSDESIVETGAEVSGADYCFPIKLAHGHLFDLARRLRSAEGQVDGETKGDIDYILTPFFISEENDPKQTTQSTFCPLNIGQSAMFRAALSQHGGDASRVLSPVIDLRWPEARQIKALSESLAAPLEVSASRLKAAWRKARAAMTSFDEERRQIGREALKRVARAEKPGIVIIGRPYNLHDERANVALPRKIAEYGHEVVPLDCLTLDKTTLPDDFRNVFWKLGQDILLGGQHVAKTEGLYAVVLTNFSCGPDSFLLSYLDEIMGDKPYLTLELDEHGADAGYLTRVEAFLDVIADDDATKTAPALHIPKPAEDTESFRERTIWLPPMHHFASPLMAAALRGAGFKAEALPEERRQDFQKGRMHMRGTECLPAPLTLGSFLRVMEEGDLDPRKQALFMPTASGPCRFGQYALLDRLIFNRAGYKDVAIMSPSSDNSYHGVGDAHRTMWFSMIAGDMLFKLGTRTRPYEQVAGQCDAVLARGLATLIEAFEAQQDPLPFVARIAEEVRQIPVSGERKPLVGIVGEIYVRSNRFANQDVVGAIERAGGEAWLAPITEWILYTALCEGLQAKEQWFRFGDYAATMLKNRYMFSSERAYEQACDGVLSDRHEPPVEETLEAGKPWFPVQFEGEAIMTVGRSIKFAEQGAGLVVNCSPFGCMVGSLSGGVLQRVQAETGVPMVNLFYDGDGELNRVLDIYIASARDKDRNQAQRSRVSHASPSPAR